MTNEDINSFYMGYNSISSHNSKLVCVGCIDGYLIHICEHSNEKFRNVSSYLSG